MQQAHPAPAKVGLRIFLLGLAEGAILGTLVGLTIGVTFGLLDLNLGAALGYGGIGALAGLIYGAVLGALSGVGFGVSTALACRYFSRRVEAERVAHRATQVNGSLVGIAVLVSLIFLVTGENSAIDSLLIIAVAGPAICTTTYRTVNKFYAPASATLESESTVNA